MGFDYLRFQFRGLTLCCPSKYPHSRKLFSKYAPVETVPLFAHFRVAGGSYINTLARTIKKPIKRNAHFDMFSFADWRSKDNLVRTNTSP